MKELLKIILSFGHKGDYNLIRRLAKKYWVFRYIYKLYEAKHCAFLPLTNSIEGDILFPHSVYGCFFSCTCHIGKDCVIMQHVTIGSNYVGGGKELGAPWIGDNVFIGAGAKIIGKVKIGNGVRIGAGCVVVKDIPAGCTCVMEQAKIILKRL